MSRRVVTIIGTRPEAIKMAPLLVALAESSRYESIVCGTGQHSELADEALASFGLAFDHDLAIMTARQTLTEITARALVGLEPLLQQLRPDLVLVHGDTATTLAGALAAFHQRIPVGHVEAGLRSGDPGNPFPEELNRTLVDRLSHHCFSPTEANRQNLIAEGIAPERVAVTGNTAIDALLLASAKLRDPALAARVEQVPGFPRAAFDSGAPLVLITAHRRESFGAGIRAIAQAIAELAAKHPGWQFVYPVHPNPNIHGPVHESLSGIANVHLTPPLGYEPFVHLMARSHIIMTDSGGLQEEAPALGKPVVVMRDRTERTEAVEAGTVLLAGVSRTAIVDAVERLGSDSQLYETMSRARNPYGDGTAARRIIEHLDRGT